MSKGKESKQKKVSARTSQEQTMPKQGSTGSQQLGRPTLLNQQVIDAICEHIEQGKSLRSFCKQEDAPAMSTVTKWLRENRAFSAQYADARARGMDAHAEEILAIADDNTQDEEEVETENGVIVRVNHDVINRAKLRIDTRKWLMSKLAPKKYGDKLDVTSGGNPIPAPVLMLAHDRPERQAD